MRLLYPSTKGGKPLNIGMNHAKRVARSADRRDQEAVQRELGAGLPRQKSHHQRIVKNRHEYYGDIYEQTRAASWKPPVGEGSGADPTDAIDAGGALPKSAAGADPK